MRKAICNLFQGFLLSACALTVPALAQSEPTQEQLDALFADEEATNPIVDTELWLYDTIAGVNQHLLEMNERSARTDRLKAEAIAAGHCDDPTPDYQEICDPREAAASIGAFPIPRHAAPFQVQLVFSDLAVNTASFARYKPDQALWQRRHLCGGALIAPNWVLTAAHCLKSEGADLYGVRLDVGNISSDAAATIPVADFIRHPDYDRSTSFNDIALVKLDTRDLALTIDEPPQSVYQATESYDQGSVLSSAQIFDDQTLVLTFKAGLTQFLDIRTGERRVVPAAGGASSHDGSVAGPGYLLTWTGLDYNLWMGPDRATLSDRFSGRIVVGDYSPEHQRVALADANGTISLFSPDAQSVWTVQSNLDVDSLEILSDERVRVRDKYGREESWHMPRNWIFARFRETLPEFQSGLQGYDGRPYDVYKQIGGVTLRAGSIFRSGRYTLRDDDGVITVEDHERHRTRTVGTTKLLNPRLALHPKGRFLVVTGVTPDYRSAQGEIWDLRWRRKISTFDTDLNFKFSTPRFTRSEDMFVLWSADGITEIRDLKSGNLEHRLNHSLPILSGKLDEDDHVTVSSEFGTVEVWDAITGQARIRAYHGRDSGGADRLDDNLLSWSRNGRLRLWDLETGKMTFQHTIRDSGDLSTARDGAGFKPAAAVSLINLSSSDPAQMPDQTVMAFGWGKISRPNGAPPSAMLRTVAVETITWEDCIQRSPNPDGSLNPALRDPNAFCAVGPQRKTCTGDSGGPVTNPSAELVGIVSRGRGGCRRDDKPTTFTSVSAFEPWIRKHVCPTQAEGQGGGNAHAYPAFCRPITG